MEKAREYHRPLHICFVDLRKAYDSVDRHTLWLVLQHCYHLPPKLLTTIKALHDHISAAVQSYGENFLTRFLHRSESNRVVCLPQPCSTYSLMP